MSHLMRRFHHFNFDGVVNFRPQRMNERMLEGEPNRSQDANLGVFKLARKRNLVGSAPQINVYSLDLAAIARDFIKGTNHIPSNEEGHKWRGLPSLSTRRGFGCST